MIRGGNLKHLTLKQKERKKLIEELSPLAKRGNRKALRKLKNLDYVVFNGINLRKMFPD